MKQMFENTFSSMHASYDLVAKTKSSVMQRMEKPQKKSFGLTKLMMGLTIMMVLIGGGYWLYFIPVVTISVDINPSIELSINRLDRVIDVKAYNSDGQTIVDTLDIQYQSYTDALNTLMDDPTIASLLSNDGIANITVVGNDSDHCLKMVETINTTVQCEGKMQCHHGDQQILQGAHDCGMSYGRYALYQLLLEYYPNLTIEEVNAMSMCQIRDMLQDVGVDMDISGYGHGYNHGHHGDGHE